MVPHISKDKQHKKCNDQRCKNKRHKPNSLSGAKGLTTGKTSPCFYIAYSSMAHRSTRPPSYTRRTKPQKERYGKDEEHDGCDNSHVIDWSIIVFIQVRIRTVAGCCARQFSCSVSSQPELDFVKRSLIHLPTLLSETESILEPTQSPTLFVVFDMVLRLSSRIELFDTESIWEPTQSPTLFVVFDMVLILSSRIELFDTESIWEPTQSPTLFEVFDMVLILSSRI